MTAATVAQQSPHDLSLYELSLHDPHRARAGVLGTTP